MAGSSSAPDKAITPYRVPITAITVFGGSFLIAGAISIALYLGLDQAAKSTQQLWAEQADSLIDAMEQSLAYQLRPVTEQARWISEEITELSDLSALDDLMIGALAATPQVSGIAVVKANGHSRRWQRDTRSAINEDWSGSPDIVTWLDSGSTRQGTSWRAPIWADPVDAATLLHDVPLRSESGEFIGMFGQIIPVSQLSHYISRIYAETGLTPFVLYDKRYVLLHPLLINENLLTAREGMPLPTLEILGDVVLGRIWSPDETEPFIFPFVKDTKVTGVFWDDEFYLYLYRDISSYGPVPWTIGAYLNTDLHDSGETTRFFIAAIAGLAVLVIAVAASIYIGRKVSTPIKAIASAAETIEHGSIEDAPTLTGSRVRELDEAASAFNAMTKGLQERELIRRTLGRFVPEKVAASLLTKGGQIDAEQVDATILFCDIEAFTQMTENLGPVRIVDVLNTYFSNMVKVLEQYDGVVTQFQGDAILATFNVPIQHPDHAARAVRAAMDMLAAVGATEFAGESLNIRIGINTGTVVAGAIGAEGRLNYTVHGDAVNLAARLESLNKDFHTRVLVSEFTTSLVDGFEFVHVGQSAIRGQTKTINLYTVTS